MLDELGAMGRRRRAGDPVRLPRVTLHLMSGRDLSGSVLDVADDAGASHVLLHVPGPLTRQPDWDVVHLPVSSVEAVTVHDVPSLSRPPDDAPPPPSRLEVKRHVAALEALLAQRLGTAIPVEVLWEDAPESLRALDGLVTALGPILTALCDEPDGLAALRARVRRVQLGVSAEASVKVQSGLLHAFQARVHAAWMDRERLRRDIEAGL